MIVAEPNLDFILFLFQTILNPNLFTCLSAAILTNSFTHKNYDQSPTGCPS